MPSEQIETEEGEAVSVAKKGGPALTMLKAETRAKDPSLAPS